MSSNLQKFSENLVLEMQELQRLNVNVPAKAFKLAKDLDYIKEYEDMSLGSRSTSECVDLLIMMAQI